MRKNIMTVCLSLMLIIGTIGAAYAVPITSKEYSANVPFFSDGFDIDTGETYRDPTVLIVVFGALDEIEQALTPMVDNLIDFDLHPDIDVHFECDPTNAENPFFVVSDVKEVSMWIAIIDDPSVDFDDVTPDFLRTLESDDWEKIGWGESLEFGPEDILVFRNPTSQYFWAMELHPSYSYSGLDPLEVHVKNIIPEPSTLLLMGLGLLGLVGIGRRKKKSGSFYVGSLMFFVFVTLFLFSSVLYAGEYKYTYKFEQPKIVTLSSGLQIVEMEGTWQNDGTIGAPILPAKTSNIFVPNGEEAVSVQINHPPLTPIDGFYTIQHATTPYPISHEGPITVDEPDPAIYSTDADYPEMIHIERGLQRYLGAQFVQVNLMPVVYNPVQGRLQYYEEIEIVITTDTAGALSLGAMPFRNLSVDRERILDIIDNKDDFLGYSQVALAPAPLGSRQYVVITTQAMVSAFQQLTDYRQTPQGGGFTTYIETIENINANYSGVDLAEKMRNFIIDCYQNYSTEYVILGGDCDGPHGNQTIPTRGCYGKTWGYTDSYIPSDLYFGCLDGTWNDDSDSRWGEPDDGENGQDIDWFSEVYVGRIAADNLTEAKNHINKIIAFETSTPSYKTLLVGEKLDNFPTWGGDRIDWVHGFMNSMPNTELCDRDWPGNRWPKDQLLAYLNSDEYSWINHLGHSGTTKNMKLFNSDGFFISNNEYVLVYSQGCYAGSIDNLLWPGAYSDDDCFGEEITNAYGDRGAFAYIGNSRYGFYSIIAGASNRAHKEFVEAIFTDGHTRIGVANQISKTDLDLTAGNYRWIAFETNLIGDPATPIFASCPYSINPMEQIFPSSGGTDSVSVSTTDGCDWIATSNVDWITITSGNSGSGNGTVACSVSANPSTNERTGTLTIAGQTFTVRQGGIPQTVSIDPAEQAFPPGGGTGSVSVSAPDGYDWTVTNNVAWITITSGNSGRGEGTVDYSVSANTNISVRTGTLTIAGQTITVAQEGVPHAGFAATYGGAGPDDGHIIQQTNDGGYIVAGWTRSFGNDSTDIWILRLDSTGGIEWQKTYGGTGGDFVSAIQQINDGGYIVAGWSSSFGNGDSDIWLLKLNKYGDLEDKTLPVPPWQKTYGGTSQDYALSIQQTNDGGYIVAGWSSSFGNGDVDIWLLKLDNAGVVTWQQRYGGTNSDCANSIQQTDDGGYIVAGYTRSFGNGSSDVLILKLNNNGIVAWQKTYGGFNGEEAYFIQQTNDGGYIVAGQTTSFGAGDSDILILKLNSSGKVIWWKTYGGTNEDRARSIQQTDDGGYIVAGRTHSFGTGDGDIWLLKLNSSGKVIWQKTYGGANVDFFPSIQQTNNGSYIVVGTTGSFGSDRVDFFVLSLDEEGNTSGCPLGEISTAQVNDATVEGEDSSVVIVNTDATITTTSISPVHTSVHPLYICGVIVKRGVQLIVRKTGIGRGTVMVGEELECGTECTELDVPYSEKTVLILKAIPDADSYFVRWEIADGSPLDGMFHAQPGDTVIAVFDKNP